MEKVIAIVNIIFPKAQSSEILTILFEIKSEWWVGEL